MNLQEIEKEKAKDRENETIAHKIKFDIAMQHINFYTNRKRLANDAVYRKSTHFLSPGQFAKHNRKEIKTSYWPPFQHIKQFKNEKKQRENNSFVNKLLYLKSGKEVVVGYNRPDRGDINFIEPDKPRVGQFYYKQLPGGLGGIATYQDGRRILIADRKGKFTWIDVVNKNLQEIKDKAVHTQIQGIIDISLSPSEIKVACGSKQSSILIYDTQIQKTAFVLSKRLVHQSSISSIMYHPFKSILLSGASNEVVNLWDVHNQSIIYSNKHHKDSITKAMFHPNGNTYYSMSKDKNIFQYDLRMRGILQTLTFDEEPKDIQFTQDLLAVGDNAGVVHFFNKYGECVSKTQGKSSILALAIDQTDSWMVVARKDGNMFDLFERKY